MFALGKNRTAGPLYVGVRVFCAGLLRRGFEVCSVEWIARYYDEVGGSRCFCGAVCSVIFPVCRPVFSARVNFFCSCSLRVCAFVPEVMPKKGHQRKGRTVLLNAPVRYLADAFQWDLRHGLSGRWTSFSGVCGRVHGMLVLLSTEL